MAYCVLFWLLLMLAPQLLVSVFTSDPELIGTAVWATRIFLFGCFAFGAQCGLQQSFLALGQAKVSLLLALLRKIVLLIPLIYILPLFCTNKLFGVFVAEPIADILAATVTTIAFLVWAKKNLSDEALQRRLEAEAALKSHLTCLKLENPKAENGRKGRSSFGGFYLHGKDTRLFPSVQMPKSSSACCIRTRTGTPKGQRSSQAPLNAVGAMNLQRTVMLCSCSRAALILHQVQVFVHLRHVNLHRTGQTVVAIHAFPP